MRSTTDLWVPQFLTKRFLLEPLRDCKEKNKQDKIKSSNKDYTKYLLTKSEIRNNVYHLAKLVFWSVRQITHAHWFLNGPIFYDVGPVQYTFYSRPVSFGERIFELILNEN